MVARIPTDVVTMPFPIPSNLTPDGEKCLILRVPDDEEWIRTVMGALEDLTHWWNFDRDEAKTGRVLAAEWNARVEEAVSNFGNCAMQIVDVTCEHVAYDDPRCSEYDPVTGILHLYIPAGAPGVPGVDGTDGADGTDGTDGNVVTIGPVEPTPGATDYDRKTEIWSGCVNLIEYLEGCVYETFAQAELGVQGFELVAAIIAVFNPLFAVAAEIVLEATQTIIDNGYAQWVATNTDTLKEQLACGLFCRIIANDYTLDDAILYDWRDWMVLNHTDLGAGTAYAGLVTIWPTNDLRWRYALGMNDGDEDWVVLCPDCAPTCEYWVDEDHPYTDWTIEAYAGYPGYWDEAGYWVGVWNHEHGSAKFIQLARNFNGRKLARLTYHIIHNSTRGDSLRNIYDDATSLSVASIDQPDGDRIVEITFDPPVTITGSIHVLLAARSWDDEPEAFMHLLSLKLCFLEEPGGGG